MSKRPFIDGGNESSSFVGACINRGICGDNPLPPSSSRNDHKSVSADAMDALVASELNQLSLEEREAVFEDLHGVSKIDEETPEKVAADIESLRQEIKKIRGKSAYDKALFLCPHYVDDPKFCLMFLRAENFNIRLAAQRMVLHFKHKLDLFGVEKIANPITLDDLSEDDKSAMMTGGMQFLPHKDRSGRTVVMMLGELFNYKEVVNQVREMELRSTSTIVLRNYQFAQIAPLFVSFLDPGHVVPFHDQVGG